MDRRTKYFFVLATLHNALLVTSTIAGSKFFELPLGYEASATVFSYMLTFIILNTIAELYGRQSSTLVINLGLAAMAVSALYFRFVIWLPPATSWIEQRSLEVILGSSLRIWLGGWTAYMVSQHFDVWSFLKLKQVPGRTSLLLRTFASTTTGQFIDTVIFLTIAFYDIQPLGPAIVGQFTVKLLITATITPLTLLSVALGRRLIDNPGDVPKVGE